ncbi:alpha/beta fold hydrolase [Fictibacillus iocasae]|uniref:Alpha/beta fold hydrolase n=1 Tax=Fictibacillus iocasae TaxID=2715437 RepID=A0ABW2NRI0_9BACL
MVHITKEKIDHVPFLMAELSELRNEPAPLFLFLHGYTSAKEHNLHFAYALAEKGFRVLLPDAPLHGEREPEDVSKRDMKFWDIVLQAVQESNAIVDHFNEKKLTIPGKIGLGGTSMGAITMYAVLSQNAEISAGISLMGTPALETFAKWQVEQLKNRGWTIPFTEQLLQDVYLTLRSLDVTADIGKLNNRPLFIWHSKCDAIIPFEQSYSFYNMLRAEGYEGRTEFMEDSASGHKVSREAFLRSVEWIQEIIS